MQLLRSLLSVVFSRAMLAFIGLVVLGLLIWFLGPLVGIDGLRPLASAAVRVGLLVLLLLLSILWLSRGPMAWVFVAATCLLIWHAGPLLMLGAVRPLQPAWARATAVGVILLASASYGLIKLWRYLCEHPDAIGQYFTARTASEEPGAVAVARIMDMTTATRRAVAQLRNLRVQGILRRAFDGDRHLYELPWYLFVGAQSAGKSTALRTCGLEFPLAGAAATTSSIPGAPAEAGATPHCDWWLGNQAVLIDTAGRYATQNDRSGADALEWGGLLALLRKHRPRAPINGAIVVVSTSDLLQMSDAQRIELAVKLRERLIELRQQLGIRFPVYVLVTKVDLLAGFSEYFHALTSEGRAQPWGFTLPWQRRGRGGSAKSLALAKEEQRKQLRAGLADLVQRIAMGLRSRLDEEFDIDRRQRLMRLPQELGGLMDPLALVLDEVFLPSRFDTTQHHSALRGVYLTSSMQGQLPVPADAGTLMQRFWRSLGLSSTDGRSPSQMAGNAKNSISRAAEAAQDLGRPPRQELATAAGSDGQRATQGYFLQDVLLKIIVPEAHLVRPNLRWEFRFRLLRLLGHAMAVVVFSWLVVALVSSFDNNRRYLETVGQRAQALGGQLRGLLADFKPGGVPNVLDAARDLPSQAGLDLRDPPMSYQYGLYSAPPVVDASATAYAQLQEHMLLPAIVRRMESVMDRSVNDQNPKLAYETLRVYKLVHDPARYMHGGAGDVRAWVLRDWESTGSAADFGSRASMLGHVERLFSGARPVQSATLPNEALVQRVQAFLDANTSTQRIYERAKAVMSPEAPQEFTLIRAVGPHAGTVFSRTDGQPLERGVPGLFTYDGYHELFSKRLVEFVTRALEDDAWVMGRAGASEPSIGSSVQAQDALRANPLVEEVRRQYLIEYVANWQAFLDSIRIVRASGGDAATSAGLGFELSVLRQLAAPDSPLARLARAASRETTLSRPLVNRTQGEGSLFDKAADQLSRQASALGKNLGVRPEERMEMQIVDNQFAALREVTTGQAETASGANVSGGAGRLGLENISALVNEFYTTLVVADTALGTGSLPPGGQDVGARLKLEAGKLPAPFREVLMALAVDGAEKVGVASADILRKQAQVQFDRIMGLMTQQVSEPCRRGVEGRYPFAAVSQDASIEDFSQVFAVGGAADEFFNKFLAAYVDTSVRPWRYKDPSAAGDMPKAEAATPVAIGPAGPTLLGELLRLLRQGGPDLEAFYRARQVRDLFFREADGRKFSWKLDLKVAELDPSITDLLVDIDGQGLRYAHGPVQPFAVAWPGPRGGTTAELTANPRVSASTSTLMANGPWALFRLLDKGRVVGSAMSGRIDVEFLFDGRRAVVEVNAASQANPLNSNVLKGFRCPGAGGVT